MDNKFIACLVDTKTERAEKSGEDMGTGRAREAVGSGEVLGAGGVIGVPGSG